MCKCTPSKRTPYCGKPGCEWPPPEKSRFPRVDVVATRILNAKGNHKFRSGYSDGHLPGLGEPGVIRTNFVTGDSRPELFLSLKDKF